MQKSQITKQQFLVELNKLCRVALKEDNALKDVTSDMIVKKNHQLAFHIIAKQDMILCGIDAIKTCFEILQESPKFKDAPLKLKSIKADGNFIKAQQVIVEGKGDAKLIFAAERVMLNLIQHLSGVATVTQQFVAALNNSKTKILDTRKTLPNWRILQRYAVRMGGATNHRFSLSDAVLIKDNHIAAAGSVEAALKVFAKSKLPVEIECDSLLQVTEAIKYKPNIIMLDNMSITDIKKAQEIIGNKAKIEISGGINLNNITKYSTLNVDFISTGAITHSAKAVDISLEIK